ncbi:MAG: 3-isopropylmalate dehydrogenase [Deltaproteobacteria bacterium]|nr:3-isopropylmalate dehydrogenase [Deltaproteobacteria bacterium]
MKKIAVIKGDGIGGEVIDAGLRAIEAACGRSGAALAFEELDVNADRFLREGKTITEGELARFRSEFDAIYFGGVGDPRVKDNFYLRDVLLKLRFSLDLYINFRPFKLYRESLCPLKDVKAGEIDFVIFRENTEGPYVGAGGFFKKGTPDEVAIQESVNTRKGVERIIRAAFGYAKKAGRKTVALADKCNALNYAHDLWHRVFYDVGEEFPEIAKDHLLADVCAMEMVRNPRRFQVIVTDNMFGDILSDLASQVVGGLGIAPSGNINPGHVSLFEPVHGSAPDIAGKGVANPIAAILTASLMLDHLGMAVEASIVESAVREALTSGNVTRDIGGSLTTVQCADFIVKIIAKSREG